MQWNTYEFKPGAHSSPAPMRLDRPHSFVRLVIIKAIDADVAPFCLRSLGHGDQKLLAVESSANCSDPRRPARRRKLQQVASVRNPVARHLRV